MVLSLITWAVGHEILSWTSTIVGWTYFAAWSLSFYPQVYENWVRKSVVGLSFDFLILNMIGHTSYLIFNAVLFWDPYVKSLYHQKYPNKGNPVEMNDVVFSIHAVTLTALTIFQCLIYERGRQVISWTARILSAVIMLIICLCIFFTLSDVINLLGMMNVLGYVKLAISLFKYVPQAWLNYRRKMTIGWSIGQIILDLTGGILSFAQMFIDAINKNDWSSFQGGNIPKLGLSFLSIFFDLIFITQHYILYRSNNEEYHEKQALERVASQQQLMAQAARNKHSGERKAFSVEDILNGVENVPSSDDDGGANHHTGYDDDDDDVTNERKSILRNDQLRLTREKNI